jgi:hypothetical protein
MARWSASVPNRIKLSQILKIVALDTVKLVGELNQHIYRLAHECDRLFWSAVTCHRFCVSKIGFGLTQKQHSKADAAYSGRTRLQTAIDEDERDAHEYGCAFFPPLI